MSLLDSVSLALDWHNSDFYKLVDSNTVYKNLINAIFHSTSSNVASIISSTYEKQHFLDEIDDLFEIWKDTWDLLYIDQALVIAYSTFDTIDKKVNTNIFRYTVEPIIEDISNSDNEFIQSIINRINDLLLYKCLILFWWTPEERDKAIKIANIQIEHLSSWKWWLNLDRWETVRNKWYELMEIEIRKEDEWVVHEDTRFTYLQLWTEEWSAEKNKLDRLIQEDEDEQRRFQIMLDLWQVKQALDLCLARLDFFSPQNKVEWIYNFLDLIRHNLTKWKRNIISLLNSNQFEFDEYYYFWYFDILIRLESFDEAWLLAKNRLLTTNDDMWHDNLNYLIQNNLLSENVKKIILSFVWQYGITE